MDSAPHVVLSLVSHADQTDLCEVYWREYGDWAVAEYSARYGVINTPDHDGIHRELPTMLGDRGRLSLAEHTVYMELSLTGYDARAKGSE